MAFAKDPYLRTLEERQKARRDAREADYLRSLHRDPPGNAPLDERMLQARWDATAARPQPWVPPVPQRSMPAYSPDVTGTNKPAAPAASAELSSFASVADAPGTSPQLQIDQRSSAETSGKHSGSSPVSDHPITGSTDHPISSDSPDVPVTRCTDEPMPCRGLEDLESFISKYLICSADQRTLLALWILHTHCFDRFRVTPYLEIRSRESESGKSTCLKILRLLCHKSWLVAGVPPSMLIKKIVDDHPTLLLDDWRSTFRASDQQKLVGFLVGGSQDSDFYAAVEHNFRTGPAIGNVSTFCPKAFAGSGTLPDALSRRSVPIVLERLEHTDEVAPFSGKTWYREAPALITWMENWVKEHRDAMIRITLNLRPAKSFPGLSPAQRDCAEPFLILADQLGGAWPEKTFNALHVAFHRHVGQDQSNALRLLSDIRDAFAQNQDHDRIFTRDLLLYLNGRKDRPWSIWHSGSPLNPNGLALLLAAFDDNYSLRSKTLRIGDKARAKGFERSLFRYIWAEKLPPAQEMSRPAGRDKKPGRDAISPSKNAACHDVTTDLQISV